jgi:hypothetical protein
VNYKEYIIGLKTSEVRIKLCLFHVMGFLSWADGMMGVQWMDM